MHSSSSFLNIQQNLLKEDEIKIMHKKNMMTFGKVLIYKKTLCDDA